MTNNICKICNKPFTRRWNLERHIQDVHQKNPYSEKAKERREINNFNGLSEGIDKKNFSGTRKTRLLISIIIIIIILPFLVLSPIQDIIMTSCIRIKILILNPNRKKD